MKLRHFSWQDRRAWLLVVPALVVGIGAFFLPRIPQDPDYHVFADGRAFWGLRNFCNVLSNAAFVAVGALGLRKSGLSRRAGLHPSYIVYCLAAVAVGLGSARYHLDPTTMTLMWDRLAMALIIMSGLALVVGDRVDVALGKGILWPGLAIGMASVLYWAYTEHLGVGDLRLYGLVQFLPLLLLLVLLSVYPSRYLRSDYLWGSLGVYALAKLGERFDQWVYDVSGFVSGHTLKHLFAAGSVCLVILSLRDRDSS